ncbi:MAG: hypothetical protein K5707_05885 [Clostridia bacterium]|nr:hypothetical protein [Clostridia bacterium]
MKELRKKSPKEDAETPAEMSLEEQETDIPSWRHDPFGNPIAVDKQIDLFADPLGVWGGLGTGILAGVLVFFLARFMESGIPVYLAIIAAVFIPQLLRTKLHLAIRHFTTWMLAGFLAVGAIGWLLNRF